MFIQLCQHAASTMNVTQEARWASSRRRTVMIVQFLSHRAICQGEIILNCAYYFMLQTSTHYTGHSTASVHDGAMNKWMESEIGEMGDVRLCVSSDEEIHWTPNDRQRERATWSGARVPLNWLFFASSSALPTLPGKIDISFKVWKWFCWVNLLGTVLKLWIQCRMS